MTHRAEVVSSDDVSGTTWRLLANLVLLGSQWKFENCFLYSPIRIHDFLSFSSCRCEGGRVARVHARECVRACVHMRGVFGCSHAGLHMGVDVHTRVCQSKVTLSIIPWELAILFLR